jgi:hypothetical protein
MPKKTLWRELVEYQISPDYFVTQSLPNLLLAEGCCGGSGTEYTVWKSIGGLAFYRTYSGCDECKKLTRCHGWKADLQWVLKKVDGKAILEMK